MAFSWLRNLFVQDSPPSMQAVVPGEPFNLPVKKPAKHQTAADVLDWLCKQHGATYDRRRVGDGAVVIRFYMPDETVVSGRGQDTLTAVLALKNRLEGLK